jgi:hypothetical protein
MWNEVKETVSDCSESFERWTQFKDWQTLSKVSHQIRISAQRNLISVKVELSFWFPIRNSSETMAEWRYDLESFRLDWVFQRAPACLSNLIFQRHSVPFKWSILVRGWSCRKLNQRMFILWIVITNFRICPLHLSIQCSKRAYKFSIGILLNTCWIAGSISLCDEKTSPSR